MSSGWTPQVPFRAACLPEAIGRCQRLSASVCHRSPVSAGSASTPSRLCRSKFPSGLWSETIRRATGNTSQRTTSLYPTSFASALIPNGTQQTQGQGVCHVFVWTVLRYCQCTKAGCVTLSVCESVQARVRLFWVTAWVRCSQAAALCKSAPSFSSHKSLPATSCHRWQPSQRKEKEGRQGVRGLKKSLRDEIRVKKGTWQHLEKRHCLWGEISLCEQALISGGWEQGRACKARCWSLLKRVERRKSKSAPKVLFSQDQRSRSILIKTMLSECLSVFANHFFLLVFLPPVTWLVWKQALMKSQHGIVYAFGKKNSILPKKKVMWRVSEEEKQEGMRYRRKFWVRKPWNTWRSQRMRSWKEGNGKGGGFADGGGRR